MRIATFNIASGFLVDADRKPIREDLEAFADQIREVNPDILCLQECGAVNGADQAHRLGEILEGYHIVFESLHPNHVAEGELGLAVLSKFSILDSELVRLPIVDTSETIELFGEEHKAVVHQKGILVASLDVDGSSMRIATTHLDAFRRMQIDPMGESYKQSRLVIQNTVLELSERAVFLGDMNMEEMDGFLPKLYQAGFVDALPKQITTLSKKWRDHILTSGDIAVRDHGQLMRCGDHALCWVDVELNGYA